MEEPRLRQQSLIPAGALEQITGFYRPHLVEPVAQPLRPEAKR